MRPLLVINLTEIIEALLLGAPMGGGRIGCFVLESEVESFVAPVLLRLAWLDALRDHSCLDQAYRQPCQTSHGTTGKRRSIVAAHGLGQAKLTECRVKDGPHRFEVRPLHGLAAQQVTTVCILQCQRIATFAITGSKPALEVDCPHIVRCRACAERRTRRYPRSSFAMDRQTGPVEYGSDRTQCRPNLAFPVGLKPAEDLLRSPGRMVLAHQNNLLLESFVQTVLTIVRRVAAIQKSANAFFLKSRYPFVAGFSAHSIPAAQLAYARFPSSVLGNHQQSFVHGTGLFPRHERLLAHATCNQSCRFTCHPSSRFGPRERTASGGGGEPEGRDGATVFEVKQFAMGCYLLEWR